MVSKESMPVTIPASKVHRQFSDVIKRTFSGDEHFVVEKDGLPVVAIISMPEYREFMELMKERKEREARVKRFQDTAKKVGKSFEAKGVTEADVAAAVEEAREEVYQETYGKPSE